MMRMLTLFIVAAACLFPLSTNCVTAQESSKSCENGTRQCPNCQSRKFELAGIDFPVEDESAKSKSNSCRPSTSDRKQISVQLSCGTGVPFMSNIPYVARLFKNVGISRCDSPADSGAMCEGATCEGATCEGATCDQACTAGCCDGNCPGARCEGKCSTVVCCGQQKESNVGTLVRLATHVEDSNKKAAGHNVQMHKMIALRIENERLQAQLEAMASHLELMEQISEVREENAALNAKLELIETHMSHASAFHGRYPTPKNATATSPAITVVRPGIPLPAAIKSTTPLAQTPPPFQTISHPALQPVKQTCRSAGHACCSDAEMQRLETQVRDLKEALHEQRSHSSRTGTTDR